MSVPQPSQINDILAWIKNNEIILGLLASAWVITMPEKLPAIKEFPQWMWEWTRDALKTFMNFRHSGAPVTDEMHQQQQAMQAPKAEVEQQVVQKKSEPQLLNE